jgi:ATP phosphoribosyltransferase
MLKLAIQKSGRLTDPSLSLITECGIEVERYNGKLRLPAYNFPLELFLLRDDDIPRYVENGVVDAAIVGENTVAEEGVGVKQLTRLGFGRCRLSIAVPRELSYLGTEDFNGKKIATSYPRILGSYLKSKNVSSTIHSLSGAVEIAPGIGIADAICDLVSSGSTLLSNGLKEVETVFTSEAVLITQNSLPDEAQGLLDQLIRRIDAVQKAKRLKYITLNIPTNSIAGIRAILPGLKSPSILALADEGWSSMHTVIAEDNFWEIIDKLKACGAEGILVMPIEKLIS